MKSVVHRIVTLSVVLTTLLVMGSAGPASSARPSPPLPTSIASIGDSITRATDVCCWYGDHPGSSWSTGGTSWDGISSHYERLTALGADITGANYNDARSGARMSDGPRQAQLAVGQRAQYVTVLLGANDVCTSSPATMTPVATFTAQAHETLQVLASGLPRRARIFVASIPDINQLWQLYRGNPTAEWVWETFGICQSLLDPSRTDADRAAVAQRIDDLNAALALECGALTRCRYDGGAVHAYQFGEGDVSTLDYFHPSLSGQARLSSVTWAASWWSS